ncbi:hypothetical protein COBT_002291, partial [Conglomerata obtusa]
MALSANWKLIQSFFAEACASFIFGFAVYSAQISSTLTDQSAAPVIVGLAVALSAIAIIYTFSDVAPAHFNPAITAAAIVYRKLSIVKGLLFIVSQLLGFMVAAAVVLGCYPDGSGYKMNIIRPKKQAEGTTRGNIICTEAFLTGILVFVAFQVAINVYKKVKYTPSKEEKALPAAEDPDNQEGPDKTILAPLVIGLTLGFLAFLGFSSSGGVFNPGLVWAPVLFSGNWIDCWAYWIGEFLGALVGGGIQYF